jgi:hypothetical protein
VEYLRRHAGLGQETGPAKQYRLQLHVATNVKLTDRCASVASESGRDVLVGGSVERLIRFPPGAMFLV